MSNTCTDPHNSWYCLCIKLLHLQTKIMCDLRVQAFHHHCYIIGSCDCFDTWLLGLTTNVLNFQMSERYQENKLRGRKVNFMIHNVVYNIDNVGGSNTIYILIIFFDFASRLSNLKVLYISKGTKCNVSK